MSLDEKDLKEKFEGYEVPPSPGLWDGIEQRLKRKRRRFLWLLLLGLFGIGTASGYWGWQHWNNNEPQTRAIQQLDRKADSLNKSVKVMASAIDSTPGFYFAKGNSKPKAAKNTGKAEQQKRSENVKGRRESDIPKTSSHQKGSRAKEVAENQPVWASLDQMALLDYQWPSRFEIGKAPVPDSPDYWVDSLADSLLKADNNTKEEDEEGKWKWGVQLMPQLTHQVVKSNEVPTQQLSKISGAESQRKGLAGEVNLYYGLSEKFQLQSGLWYAYDQANFRYESQTTSQKALQYPDDQNQDNLTVPSSVGPPEDSSETTTYVFRNTNQYFRVGIPLLLRYKVFEESRWQLYVTSGMQVNYMHGLDQNFVGPQGRIVYNIDDPANELVRNFNLRYNLRLGLQYALNDEWSLAATPAFKASLFSSYADQHFLESRPLQFGVGIGFIKDF